MAVSRHPVLGKENKGQVWLSSELTGKQEKPARTRVLLPTRHLRSLTEFPVKSSGGRQS
jgi:hypothetical protein